MSEHIKQFINSIAAGNASEAKEALENELASRSFAALDEYKQLIAQGIFGGEQETQVEVQETE
jgi:hypothetical protein